MCELQKLVQSHNSKLQLLMNTPIAIQWYTISIH